MASEPPSKRSAHALSWEMIELQVQMVLDEPDVWVKSLAVILETLSRQSTKRHRPFFSA